MLISIWLRCTCTQSLWSKHMAIIRILKLDELVPIFDKIETWTWDLNPSIYARVSWSYNLTFTCWLIRHGYNLQLKGNMPRQLDFWFGDRCMNIQLIYYKLRICMCFKFWTASVVLGLIIQQYHRQNCILWQSGLVLGCKDFNSCSDSNNKGK